MMQRKAGLLLGLVTAGLIIAGAMAQDNARRADRQLEDSLAAEAPYLAENNAAMNKMMTDMNVKPTGEIDADFSAMMIPHHQGAIDMAVAELRYGNNEKMRRIAQEIIVEQQQEIAAMHIALGRPLPPSAAAQTQVTAGQPIDLQNHLMTHGVTSSSPIEHE